MSLIFKNNLYINLDLESINLNKIEVIIDENNNAIEDINFELIEPNIMICYESKGVEIDYNNIFTSVDTIITNTAITKNIDKIPEYIKRIIIDGETVMQLMMKEEHKIDKIIEKCEIININYINNNNGNTALIYACKENMESTALKLLEKVDININHVNNSGNTALMYACLKNMEKTALNLLERENINVNKVNRYNYNSALTFACSNKMEFVALKLLEKPDININQVNKQNETALKIAKRNNLTEIITKLKKINKNLIKN